MLLRCAVRVLISVLGMRLLIRMLQREQTVVKYLLMGFYLRCVHLLFLILAMFVSTFINSPHMLYS